MPEMDGVEATRRIREYEQETGKRIPIIALTANIMQESRTVCMEAGMDDFLSKPVQPEQLKKMLQQWLPHNIPPLPPSLAELNPHKISTEKTSNLLDEASLNMIRSLQQPDKPDLLKKVITLYLNDTPVLLQSLSRSIDSKHSEAVAELIYSLISSSAQLGANTLVELAQKLEIQTSNQEWDSATELMMATEQNYAAVDQALQDVILIKSSLEMA